MRRGHSLGAGLVAGLVVAVAHVGPARADFTETFCANSPPPPWSAVADEATFPATGDLCTEGGDYQFGTGAASLAPQTLLAAGISAPPGETFTAASVQWTTQPYTGGGEPFVEFRYGAGTTLAAALVSSSPTTQTFTAGLPQTTEFSADLYCSTSDGQDCSFAAPQGLLQLGATTMTVHDTGTPTVAATGGSLATGGTVKGAQTLLYHATDTGSGVQRVTVSLGATVVATDVSSCEAASLTPCPATVDGTLSANTAAVPDGTYPVILTAYDVSGDATPVQVATVTVANRVGTTTVHPSRRRRAIRTKVTFKWDPRARSTRLIWTHFGRLPARAHVTVTCRGHRRPFHRLRASTRSIAGLERQLRHRTFHAGDRLTVTITAPRRRRETGTIRIRDGRLPVTVTVTVTVARHR